MKLHPAILPLCQDLANAGGRAYIVGGWVRDLHLGMPSKDVDLEVFGLEQDRVLAILGWHGKAHAVGKSFGVLKLRMAGEELDVALPFDGQAPDPHLPLERAVLRRDLRCNALYYDPLSGETLDPTGGLEDLRLCRLRAVSDQSLLQDPLRALRAVRFACTKGMELDPALAEQIRVTSLAGLATERVLGELRKLLGSADPAKGLSLLHSTALDVKIFPSVDGQAAADRVAKVQPHLELLAQRGHRESLLWGTWLLELPDPADSLAAWGLHKVNGAPLKRWLPALKEAQGELSDTDLRRLADTLPVLLPLVLHHALRVQDPRPGLLRAQRLGVADGPLPTLLGGAELGALGVPPGPDMGQILKGLRESQWAGQVSTTTQAHAFAAQWLQRHP
ncbi:MAG: tRNA nucleotidyltransferase (CCA-adding enzyme) [Cognaticolwellia sp.]|jgi:tRNA nucleotidyltransferase (CCA-adding enzyme)